MIVRHNATANDYQLPRHSPYRRIANATRYHRSNNDPLRPQKSSNVMQEKMSPTSCPVTICWPNGSVASIVVSAEPSPVLAQGLYGGTPAPSPTDSGPTQLPSISVEGQKRAPRVGTRRT